MPDDCQQRTEADAEMLSVSKAQLEQLERLASVGSVASSVAHEFNNILTTILNHAKRGTRTQQPEQIVQSFDRILTSARRAARITTGMLALSRNRTSRMEAVDVTLIVEDVLAVVEKDLSVHRVQLERDFRDKPRVNAVSWQIEQVLLNLIINARQSMPNGGRLIVGIETDPSDIVGISVKDFGTGIEPENLNRIFDPFFSTKSGPDESGQGGSGLGLSVCRDIIERHQGAIRVESCVGQGTTFTIRLPAAAPATQAA